MFLIISISRCGVDIMCISMPQRVLSYENGKADVEFMGKVNTVRSPFPLMKGEYVLCQAGLVSRRIPEGDAREMLKEWSEMNGL